MIDSAEKKALITTRDGTLDDLAFIYATWLKGLRYGSEWFQLIDQDVYFKCYHQVLEGILNKPETEIKIACLVEDPSVIIGYSVSRGTTLDYAFVKKPWRNIGICRDLMPAKVSTVTHMTKVGESLLKKAPGVKFNPFAI